MKKIVLAVTLASFAVGDFSTIVRAESPPCEDMLKTLDETMKTAKLNDADMKAVADLKAKAQERCTAEDDKRSDTFVTEAMKIMGK